MKMCYRFRQGFRQRARSDTKFTRNECAVLKPRRHMCTRTMFTSRNPQPWRPSNHGCRGQTVCTRPTSDCTVQAPVFSSYSSHKCTVDNDLKNATLSTKIGFAIQSRFRALCQPPPLHVSSTCSRTMTNSALPFPVGLG
jgi:hypothetical protein